MEKVKGEKVKGKGLLNMENLDVMRISLKDNKAVFGVKDQSLRLIYALESGILNVLGREKKVNERKWSFIMYVWAVTNDY